jgi:hypothetical protein
MRNFLAFVLLATLAAGQPPQGKVREQDLAEPGQPTTEQPKQTTASPAQQSNVKEIEPAPNDKSVGEPKKSAPQAPPEPAKPEVPTADKQESGQSGKPVAAFWIVIPGK